MKYQRRFLLPLALLLSLPALLGMISVGSPVPSFSIEDQFQKKWSKADYNGKITLYILCDKKGYDHVDNWTDRLVPKYRNDIQFVPVADVSPVPGFLKSYIRGQFKDNFAFSVLMDWEGVLVKAFQMQAGYPTLVLADKKGIVQYRVWGTGSEAQIQRLQESIDGLIEE